VLKNKLATALISKRPQIYIIFQNYAYFNEEKLK